MGEALSKAAELDSTYIMHTYGRSKLFTRGAGAHLYDDEGAEYLDFLAGIAVCPLGHADPIVTAAIAEQAAKVLQTSNYFYCENRGEVAQLICQLAGEEYGWKTFFGNSGAEANECAMKVARRWAIENKGPHCQTIVTMRGSFHGRTMETLAATAQDWLQDPFQPLPGGFRSVPANDCAALDAAMDDTVCAIMLEPIQGESGVWPMSDEYLKHVRAVADSYGCLVIFDEVQTGLFRCGKPFCFQTVEGVVPDIFTLAKGIANGVPCGACVARGAAAEVLKPGMQGSTFGGSQLAMAAARATLEQLICRKLDERAAQTGAYLCEQLAGVPYVTEVRGKGLMVGATLDAAHDAHAVVDALMERHIVGNACNNNVLRLLPALIIGKPEVDTLIAALKEL
jgi:acetylornithine/N-succinyldiaminopimelate aminotransferase